MDFGSIRRSEYKVKNKIQLTVTIIDGLISYLNIVDRVSIYICGILTTSKSLPISIAQKVVHHFKCYNGNKTVRTDKGEIVGKSSELQKMLTKITNST